MAKLIVDRYWELISEITISSKVLILNGDNVDEFKIIFVQLLWDVGKK